MHFGNLIMNADNINVKVVTNLFVTSVIDICQFLKNFIQ